MARPKSPSPSVAAPPRPKRCLSPQAKRPALPSRNRNYSDQIWTRGHGAKPQSPPPPPRSLLLHPIVLPSNNNFKLPRSRQQGTEIRARLRSSCRAAADQQQEALLPPSSMALRAFPLAISGSDEGKVARQRLVALSQYVSAHTSNPPDYIHTQQQQPVQVIRKKRSSINPWSGFGIPLASCERLLLDLRRAAAAASGFCWNCCERLGGGGCAAAFDDGRGEEQPTASSLLNLTTRRSTEEQSRHPPAAAPASLSLSLPQANSIQEVLFPPVKKLVPAVISAAAKSPLPPLRPGRQWLRTARPSRAGGPLPHRQQDP
ncbi:hypothetical protein BRADI_1g62572v3 [Brachypodium distachyon]|uniref:Uncharacterized protein n=1 Tax=Brachypodium distachyon TaxID=15368 RepID=A0A0Q3LFH4_BRADI|nr:hypothetical protein BRADI_1g62572v3 [Brachypodium distachyon]